MKQRVAALVADGFQDSEYFLPKIALQDQLDLDLGVMNPESAVAYNAFQRTNRIFRGQTVV